jgi:hypothetical protein
MIRTQIQLTPEQARVLKQMAAREGKSIAELIRISVDALVQAGGIKDDAELRRRAIAAAGKLHGPTDLAAHHDQYLAEAYNSK